MSYIKQCVICGNEFETINPRIITCSKECSEENRRRKEKEYRSRSKESKVKLLYHKVCPVCKKEFDTYKYVQEICSPECRAIAERERQARYDARKKAHPENYKQFENKLLAKEEIDHKYDWLKKFDSIVKEALKNGTSYGKIVAKNK